MAFSPKLKKLNDTGLSLISDHYFPIYSLVSSNPSSKKYIHRQHRGIFFLSMPALSISRTLSVLHFPPHVFRNFCSFTAPERRLASLVQFMQAFPTFLKTWRRWRCSLVCRWQTPHKPLFAGLLASTDVGGSWVGCCPNICCWLPKI